MPWSHCQLEFIMDDEVCPACGMSKSDWTLQIDQTRDFVIGSSSTRKGRSKHDAWLEVQLLDADGRPLADQPYEVSLPDSRVRTGTTDASGVVRIEKIKAGTCRLALPGHTSEAFEVETGARHELEAAAGFRVPLLNLTGKPGEFVPSV